MLELSADLPRRVQIVIYPGFKLLEASGALSVFEYANKALVKRGATAPYRVSVAAPVAGQVPSDVAVTLQAEGLYESAEQPDTVLIVGAHDIATALLENPRLVSWCKTVGPHASRLVGVCSGAFFLASAGILDGLEATTHWRVAEKMARDYPAIRVNDQAIYIQQASIWTCAGVTSVLDLCLALIEQDMGRETAYEIARELVVFLKRGGQQSQLSQLLDSQMTPHAGVRSLKLWILQNLHAELNLQTMAAQANMSPRHLRRVFAREAGCTPTEFVEGARLELAQRLLIDVQTPLKRIAERCGFSSEEQLRRVFLRHQACSPKAYREKFAPTLNAVD
ncbi:AraC family transcriptional regulator [Pseudomonas sp. PA15(2017)]|uniref:GlxA family transcriptional regulator n=1 Tax=Pseudomonas sp. PA15(2017) TaxID=1932111 RepID=UPI000965CCC1|nr:helix-turn-helix domain-containing protein [Pseudomonas sp. PA15(2017)]OLU22364.1 AraC family transcriptional regulator [Pseudomonas sp. PA15(2017)]